MKLLFSFLLILCVGAVTSAQTGKYSIGSDVGVGIKGLTNMSGMDKVLTDNGYPAMVEHIGTLQSGGGNVNFSFGRWGLLYSMNTTYLNTPDDENGHYYNGAINEIAFGLSYELLNVGIFSLAPFVSIASNKADIYLDYLMEEGIQPTALKVEGLEAVYVLGLNTYFRIKSWDKSALFLMANTSYGLSSEGKWRFNNMRIESKDFNMSAFNASGGLAFRYRLKMKKE